MGERLDILAFGAHPDDVEIGAGGILAKHAEQGLAVGICDLTFAELSSNGNPHLRQEEANNAKEILGITVRLNLGFPDRGLLLHKDYINGVVDVLRLYKPKIVLTPYWEDRHPDHMWCQKIVEEAVFSAGIKKYETSENYVSHKVETMYHYFINDETTPSLIVDISSTYGKKTEALLSYRSQFHADEAIGTVKTPLNQRYLEMVEGRAKLMGHKIGTNYAEGLLSKRPIVQQWIVGREG